MKYLVIFLFFFSIYSYSTEIKEKVLICIDEEKYIKKDITKSDYIFGYIFKNKSANYYYNSVMDNGMYEIDYILNVKYSKNEIISLTIDSYYNNLLKSNTSFTELVNDKAKFLILYLYPISIASKSFCVR